MGTVQNVTVQNVTDVLGATLKGAVENTVTTAPQILLGLIAAIIVFVFGWVLAVIISRILGGVLKAIKLEEYLKSHKVEDALGRVKISDVVVKVVKYYIILIFLQAAASLVALPTISNTLGEILVYAPSFIAAIVLVLLSGILGEYVKEVILELHTKSPVVRLVARVSKVVIVFVGITMGLSTMGIDATIPTQVFLTLVQAVAFGLALAVGIAFGLGSQKDAKDIVGKWRKHLKI
jgi:hypothetical protein